MNRINIYLGITFLVFCYSSLMGQVKTNYELVEHLIDLSVQNIVEDLDNKDKYVLKFTSDDEYSVLESKVLRSLQKNNIELVTESTSNETINYSLEDINLFYPDIFRDGLLGNYIVSRSASLKITHYLSNKSQIGQAIEYNESIQDTVLYSDFNRIENLAYTFTSSELPSEPFFSSSLEPVVAIGTAAVAVYLLFNLRSK